MTKLKCYMLGLIEPVYERYWKVQVTVHATRLSFEFRNIRRCVHTAVNIRPCKHQKFILHSWLRHSYNLALVLTREIYSDLTLD
jgi:hypothetical protein